MARKPKTEPQLEMEIEETDGSVQPDHADGEVSSTTSEGQEEVHEQTEEEVLASALIQFGYNEVYADALKRAKKLTKQERGMLLERVMKPPK